MYNVNRIMKMEELFDELTQKLNKIEFSDLSDLNQKIRELELYYTSDEWKEDFDADCNHLLPTDLKRGILSEDGIYLLLEKYDELKRELL